MTTRHIPAAIQEMLVLEAEQDFGQVNTIAFFTLACLHEILPIPVTACSLILSTVKPMLNGQPMGEWLTDTITVEHLLSGHPLLSSQLLKSRNYCQ